MTPGKRMTLTIGDDIFDLSGIWQYAVTAEADRPVQRHARPVFSICGAGRAVVSCLLYTSPYGPIEAGGPYELTICYEDGAERISRQCYAGEVFLCSGQSNMELPMAWVRAD